MKAKKNPQQQKRIINKWTWHKNIFLRWWWAKTLPTWWAFTPENIAGHPRNSLSRLLCWILKNVFRAVKWTKNLSHSFINFPTPMPGHALLLFLHATSNGKSIQLNFISNNTKSLFVRIQVNLIKRFYVPKHKRNRESLTRGSARDWKMHKCDNTSSVYEAINQ